MESDKIPPVTSSTTETPESEITDTETPTAINKGQLLVAKCLKMTSIKSCRRTVNEIRKVGVSDLELVQVLKHLVGLYDDRKEFKESAKWEEEIVAVVEKHTLKRDAETMELLRNSSDAFINTEEFEKAEKNAQLYLDINEKIRGPEYFQNLLYGLGLLRAIYSHQDRHEELISVLERIITTLEKEKCESWEFLTKQAQFDIATCKIKQKRFEEGEVILQQLLRDYGIKSSLEMNGDKAELEGSKLAVWELAEKQEAGDKNGMDIFVALPSDKEKYRASKLRMYTLRTLAFLYRGRKMYGAAEYLSRSAHLIRRKLREQDDLIKQFKEVTIV